MHKHNATRSLTDRCRLYPFSCSEVKTAVVGPGSRWIIVAQPLLFSDIKFKLASCKGDLPLF